MVKKEYMFLWGENIMPDAEKLECKFLLAIIP
jgi:hypothetical protein